MPYSSDSPSRSSDIRFGEFVTLIALLMGLTALSIDIMLVALPNIAQTYAIAQPNDRQLIVTAYLVGFAVGQPFHGPLSDRFGRKPVLAAGLVIFALGALASLFAPSYATMLAARAVQGFGAAAPRVIAIAIVRDRFAGRHMARVMSFVMMVFIIVPILAPTIGEAIMWVADWRSIFGFLFAVGVLALAWTAFRLPETRSVADRLPLSAGTLASTFATVVTNRKTL
ncbi:MAG TPA: MFS transporter, partial [Alphaproteobacteria bacterium]|nr:MFS transporter [Alphaproteobacteria bacterium]